MDKETEGGDSEGNDDDSEENYDNDEKMMTNLPILTMKKTVKILGMMMKQLSMLRYWILLCLLPMMLKCP